MAEDSTDVLMTFLNGGNGVPAECQAKWDKGDSMKTDFTTGTFFQIDDFSLGAGLESEDSDDEEDSRGESSSGGNNLSSRNARKSSGSQKSKKSRGNKFSKYILEGSLRYPIDMEEISISRQLDKASPIFLESCLKLHAFTKAVIVKRKVVGGVMAKSNVSHQGFLRLEFNAPLITSVDWEDGDTVQEKLKFICRGVSVAYRPQKPDGSLGDPVSMSWDLSRLS